MPHSLPHHSLGMMLTTHQGHRKNLLTSSQIACEPAIWGLWEAQWYCESIWEYLKKKKFQVAIMYHWRFFKCYSCCKQSCYLIILSNKKEYLTAAPMSLSLFSILFLWINPYMLFLFLTDKLQKWRTWEYQPGCHRQSYVWLTTS